MNRLPPQLVNSSFKYNSNNSLKIITEPLSDLQQFQHFAATFQKKFFLLFQTKMILWFYAVFSAFAMFASKDLIFLTANAVCITLTACSLDTSQ